MFFWFIGAATLAVWFVFHDPRFDNRFLILGVLIPDPIDLLWGGARGLHSVAASVALLLAIMLATMGRRPMRRRLLCLPIGTFLHLVFDGAFGNTRVFWWPFSGLSFSGARLPSVERGLLNVVFEVFGIALCAFAWRRFGLADPDRRRSFLRTGSLAFV